MYVTVQNEAQLEGAIQNETNLEGIVQNDAKLEGSVQNEGSLEGTVQNQSTIEGTVQEERKLNGTIYGSNSLTGAMGAFAGRSAYEIALNHGFEGTEEEWLESLKGAIQYKAGSNISIEGNVISVITTDIAEQDNSRPITSAAVHTQIGNIQALLETI